jgi:type VI secretion system protein VasJ
VNHSISTPASHPEPETNANPATPLSSTMSLSHPWCLRLLTPLPDVPDAEAGESTMDDPGHDPRWEYIDTALLKLGTLQHAQVDTARVCECALQLLESRSKDLRLLTQLLRALLQAAAGEQLLLALQLLSLWLAEFGPRQQVPPLAARQRLLEQNLDRLQGACTRLTTLTSRCLQHDLREQASRLEALCLAQFPELATVTDKLGRQIAGLIAQATDTAPSLASPAPLHHSTTCANAAMGGIDPANDANMPRNADRLAPQSTDRDALLEQLSAARPHHPKAWRQTLCALASHLIALHPTQPIGYRMRRYAIWHAIDALPQHVQNRTALAAPAPDRVHDYQRRLQQPDPDLWRDIEQSLTLTPFWFVGHWLSAQVATHLGYQPIAQAIAQELRQFLQHWPGLEQLQFADGSLLLPPECASWLLGSRRGETMTPVAPIPHQDLDSIEVALRGSTRFREQFHLQLAFAQELERQQKTALASHYYRLLHQSAQRVTLAEWQPEILSLLADHCQHIPTPERHD